MVIGGPQTERGAGRGLVSAGVTTRRFVHFRRMERLVTAPIQW